MVYPFQFCFKNDQFSIIYQEILIFFLPDEQLHRKSTFYLWFINICKRRPPPQSLKNFMEWEVAYKKIIHTPPPKFS